MSSEDKCSSPCPRPLGLKVSIPSSVYHMASEKPATEHHHPLPLLNYTTYRHGHVCEWPDQGCHQKVNN